MADETPPNALPAADSYFKPIGTEGDFGTIQVVQPQGHTIEDALRPEYWAHHAHKLKGSTMTGVPGKDWAGSIIQLRTEDHAHYAELYVRAVLERALAVQLNQQPEYFGIKAVETKRFRTRWNGAKKAVDVIRKSDNQIVATAATKELAKDWIEKTEAEKAMA
jgi:hypothetical protein